MKRIIIILLLLNFFFFSSRAQETGIRFEEGLNWEQVKQKANQENKGIFVDFYATWCGPCKYMEKNIFLSDKVGAYFNDHFVSVKIQMDKTPGDSPAIKDWYEVASKMGEELKIGAYPTYLFFSAEGKPLHRFTGASEKESEFLAKAEEALDPRRQSYILLANWEEHKQDSAYLLYALHAARNADDQDVQRKMIGNFLGELKTPLTRENVMLIYPLIFSKEDAGFGFYLQNVKQIDLFMNDAGYVEKKLGPIIFKENVMPQLADLSGPVDWQSISAAVKKLYPGLDPQQLQTVFDRQFGGLVARKITGFTKEKSMSSEDWVALLRQLKKQITGYDCEPILLINKFSYYKQKHSWDTCSQAVLTYIRQYPSKVTETFINNICWDIVFLHCKDKKVLRSAVAAMKDLVDKNPDDCEILDTYANLLYKSGSRNEAMLWENKALDISMKKNMKDEGWGESLAKMKSGKPTWEDVK